MPASEIFSRRLLVVAGKGGVGKTTVSCALALEAARRQKRVLVCEIDGADRAARLLEAKPAPPGQVIEARPGVFHMAVEGTQALAEYLQLIVPVKRILAPVFQSRIYQYFVAAAPGLKELMTIGKIWYEARQTDAASGRPCWDLIILDAPATGHSLQYLRMPAAARDAFGSGLVHRESERILALLTDPGQTAINLVTTAEEMPANETTSIFRQLKDELRMPTGILFVNRIHQSNFSKAEIDALRQAAARRRRPGDRTLLFEIAARANEEASWTQLNARYHNRLERQIAMPVVDIPLLLTEEFGLPQVDEIAAVIRDRLSRDASEGKGA